MTGQTAFVATTGGPVASADGSLARVPARSKGAPPSVQHHPRRRPGGMRAQYIWSDREHAADLLVDRAEKAMNRKVLMMLLVGIAGCSRGMDKVELPGLYSVESDYLKQEVTIRADGKYINALYRDNRQCPRNC